MSRIKFVVEEEEEVTLIECQNDHSPKSSQQTSVANLEFASNVNEKDSGSGLDPLSASSSSQTTAAEIAVVAAPSPEVVPLLIGKKPLSRVPPLTLEERKARIREASLRWYHRQKANLVDPEIRAEKLRRKREYQRKHRQQRLANATPEQREQIRLDAQEAVKRHLKNETEEQRKRRLEHGRQYSRKRKQQLFANATPEQREQIRLDGLEKVRRQLENESEEQRQQRLERGRQYYHKVGKRRMEQQWQTMTPEEREKKRAIYRENYYKSKNRKKKKESLEKPMESLQTSMSSTSLSNLVVDNCEASTSNHLHQYLSNDNNGMEQIDPEQQQGSLLDHSESITAEPYPSFAPSLVGDLDPRTEVPISSTVDSDSVKEVSFSVSVPVPMVDSVPETTEVVPFSVPVPSVDSTEPSKLTQLDNPTEPITLDLIHPSTSADTPTLTTTIISTDLESPESSNLSILTANNSVPRQVNGTLVPASMATVSNAQLAKSSAAPSLPLATPDGASTSWWQSGHSTFNDPYYHHGILTSELDVEPGREEEEEEPPDGATRLSEYNLMSMKVNQEQQPEEVLAVNLETEIEVALKSKRCTRSVKIPNEMVVKRKQQRKKPRLAKLTPDQREHRKIVERNRLLKELSTPETRQAILERWRREREKPLFWPYNLVNRKRLVKETAALDLNRTTNLKKKNRKPPQKSHRKRLELSGDSVLSNFAMNGEGSNSQINLILELPKPEPPTIGKCQRNVKSNKSL